VSAATASISAPRRTSLRDASGPEILKEPAYPQASSSAETQQLKALETVQTEPTQLASERLNRHLSRSRKAMCSTRRRAKNSSGAPGSHAGGREELFRPVLAPTRRFAVVGPVAPADMQRAAADLLGT